MAIIYNPGEKVRDLIIEQQLHNGAMAISYVAREGKGGKGARLFVKQYKSPSIRVSWYREFIAYQREIRTRLESTPCRDFCYRFLDSFEYERCFFQTFEFLDKSDSLQQVLDRTRKRPALVNWEQRRLMARVLMSGIRTLHESRIVHADLKPDNIMLIQDASIRMKYRLKIIDLDFSLLTDRQAPWHGHEGYFGTPGYVSPEHLMGQVPVPASDVFTCGIMLYELLAQGYPFADTENALEHYQAYRVGPPRLQGTMPLPARDSDVRDLLHRCLDPDPANRPTASAVFEALTGQLAPPPPRTAPVPAPVVRPAAPVLPAESAPAIRLVLRAPGGEELSFGARTPVGRVLCARFGEDARYCAEHQFILDRDETGWWIEPVAGTPNGTLLNGAALNSRSQLHSGDRLGVGRPGGKSVRLPLIILC